MALAGLGVWPVYGAAAAAPQATAQAWYRGVLSDLRPLQSTLTGALTAASGWAAGSESASAARRVLTQDVPHLERVQQTLAKLSPLQGHLAARDDYVSGITLYAESLRVDEAATEVPTRALRGQLRDSSERIRQLGDNVFDQGTAELAPLLGPNLAGADVAAAARVPDWTAVGLEPALPLESTWSSNPAEASGTQSKRSWAAEVGLDGAPPQGRVHAALVGHPRQADLAQMASALSAAEAFVTSAPAPSGDPQGSNRLRLGLLVDAEGLLTAEASGLCRGAPAHVLAAAAAGLSSVGGTLRDER
jgi:hypothetical protein